jgi:hypothetical protein
MKSEDCRVIGSLSARYPASIDSRGLLAESRALGIGSLPKAVAGAEEKRTNEIPKTNASSRYQLRCNAIEMYTSTPTP